MSISITEGAKVFFKRMFVLSWFFLVLHAISMHTMAIQYDNDGMILTFDLMVLYNNTRKSPRSLYLDTITIAFIPLLIFLNIFRLPYYLSQTIF